MVVVVVMVVLVALFKESLVGFFVSSSFGPPSCPRSHPFVDAALVMPDHTMSLVHKTFRKRVRADSNIGIADLMDPFKKFFDARGSRDLKKLLDCPMDLDWKCIPQQRWLVRNIDLFKGLLTAAPNAVVTSRKLKDALKRLQEEGAINQTRKDNSDFYDWIDMKIRIGLSQLRDLKSNSVSWERCMKRSTAEERAELKSIMEMIVLNGTHYDDSQETQGDEEGHDQEERDTTTKSKAADEPNRDEKKKKSSDIQTPKKRSSAADPAETFALVERCGTPTSKVCASSGSSPSRNRISPSKVFKNILEKKKMKKAERQKKAEEEEGHGSSSESVENSSPSMKKNKHVRRKLSFEEAAKSDEEEDKQAKTRTASLVILPAGKKILKMQQQQRQKKSAAAQQHGQGQSFLDNLLDAAVQADEEDESNDEAQGSNPKESQKESKKKRKKEEEEEEEEGAAHKKSKNEKKDTDLSAVLALFLTL